MIKIYTYNISQTNKEQLLSKVNVLSQEEKQRAGRFRFEKDFKLYTAGKLMARNMIAELFSKQPQEIRFRIDEYDRPHLSYPSAKNFDFNLSHSGDWVVLASSDGRVGIDVELIKPIDLGIARECFHDKEIEHLHGDPEKKLENFYKIWTLKESFIKAIGEGLSYPLKSFYFEFFDESINFISLRPTSGWSFIHPAFAHGYRLSICTQGDNPSDEVELINYRIE